MKIARVFAYLLPALVLCFSLIGNGPFCGITRIGEADGSWGGHPRSREYLPCFSTPASGEQSVYSVTVLRLVRV